MRSLVLAVLLGSQVAAAADLPMVGIDQDGQPIEILVTKEKYRQQMKDALKGVQVSALPVLEKHEAASKWSLRSIVVGIGLSIEVGVGPILKLGAAPRFRALFSNSNDPVLP